MMKELSNNRIKIDPPKYTLKITGTRLATILGYDDYSTPFQAWAEIVKVYKKPFEETKYIRAGKIVEPKQAAYIKNKYKLERLVSPTDVFGPDYIKNTYGDFYKDIDIFGGMWDYKVNREDGSVGSILEMKTTQSKKRSEWDKKLPFKYVLQAGLYTFLAKSDKFVLVATYLLPDQYDNPEAIEVNDENTTIYPFKLSKDLSRFKIDYIDPAVEWWNKHVITGISPSYDPSNPDDMKVLEAIRKLYPVKTYETKDINTNDYFE